MKKQHFVKLLQAVCEEDRRDEKISAFIGSYADSNIVLEPGPCNKAILEYLMEITHDEDEELIYWYLYEPSRKEIYFENGVYTMLDEGDLYDYLMIFKSEDEDIAAHIANSLEENDVDLLNKVGTGVDLYMYICHHTDEAIAAVKAELPYQEKVDNRKLENNILELKYLKEEIEKEGKPYGLVQK